MSLAESLEKSADELPKHAESIRPANGDPWRLLELLEADGAKQVLEWLLIHDADAVEELAAVWLEDERGAEIVLSVEDDGLPKRSRKILRRMAHRARSQGIEVDPKVGVEPKVARLPEVDQRIESAFVSALDPRGSRLVYLIESHPARGARVFESLLDLERGVVDFQVFETNRKQVRTLIHDVTHRPEFPAVEAEMESVRGLILRHLSIHPPDRPLPTAFVECRSKLRLDASEALLPGIQVREALGDDFDEAGIESLVAKVETGELGPWPPASEVLKTFQEKLRADFEADEAGEVEVEGAETTGIGDASPSDASADSLERIFLTEAAEITAERLEESAYVFWRQGEESLARACLASAGRLIEDPPRIGVVTKAMLERISGALLADLKSPHQDQ